MGDEVVLAERPPWRATAESLFVFVLRLEGGAVGGSSDYAVSEMNEVMLSTVLLSRSQKHPAVCCDNLAPFLFNCTGVGVKWTSIAFIFRKGSSLPYPREGLPASQ